MFADMNDIKITEGATFYESWEAVDQNGLPVDLTGYTGLMQIRATQNAPQLLLECTTANGRIIITENKVVVTCPVDQLTTLFSAPITRGVYDLFLTAPNGFVTPAFFGNAILKRAVSRA